MAKGHRKLPVDATHPDSTSYGKDELDKLIELRLHLELRIHAAIRLGLPKVRLDMIDLPTCEILLKVLMETVDGYRTRR
jgi:hypothetical protein